MKMLHEYRMTHVSRVIWDEKFDDDVQFLRLDKIWRKCQCEVKLHLFPAYLGGSAHILKIEQPNSGLS